MQIIDANNIFDDFDGNITDPIDGDTRGDVVQRAHKRDTKETIANITKTRRHCKKGDSDRNHRTTNITRHLPMPESERARRIQPPVISAPEAGVRSPSRTPEAQKEEAARVTAAQEAVEQRLPDTEGSSSKMDPQPPEDLPRTFLTLRERLRSCDPEEVIRDCVVIITVIHVVVFLYFILVLFRNAIYGD